MVDKITIDDFIMGLFENDVIRVAFTPEREYLCAIQNAETGKYKTYSLNESECKYVLNQLFYEQEKKYLSTNQMKKCIEILSTLAYANKLSQPLASRIYTEGQELIVYDINEDISILIEPGNVEYCEVDEWTFRRDENYQPQCEPDLMISPDELYPLIKKHFNFKSEYDIKLFMLYLVSAFLGNTIQHYLLCLVGEKGSSKSSTMKKVARLIDPQRGNVIGAPKNVEDLQLRLHHNYFLGLDNLSYINQRTSDVLCQAVTGSEATRRKLFTDCEELVLNIKCMVAINSVSMIVSQSDLIDRCLLLGLNRIEPKKLKPENEMMQEFEQDIPMFLGAIFNTVAEAMDDVDGVAEETELVRLADYHIAAIKIGKVLGISEEEVNKLMWRNQAMINSEMLLNDVLGTCILQYFECNSFFRGSVTDFLLVIREVRILSRTLIA